MHALLFLFSLMTLPILALRTSAIYAFVLYQFVYFLSPGTRWWSYQIPDLRYALLTSLFIIFMFFITKKEEKNPTPLLSSPHLKWMYALGAIYGLTYFYAEIPSFHSVAFIDMFKSIVVISFVFKLCSKPQHVDLMIKGYVAGATYLSFYTYQIGRNAGDRVEGVGTVDAPDANDVAALLAPALLMAGYFFYRSKTIRDRAIWLVCSGLIANALILINSRGAFLGVIVAVIFVGYKLISTKIYRSKHIRKVIAIGSFAIIGMLSILDQAAMERFFSISEETEMSQSKSKESGSTRIQFWLAAIDMSIDYPLGKGAYGFNAYSRYYISEDVDTGGAQHKTVHSTWFEALTEIGYLGLFILLGLVYTIYYSLSRVRKMAIFKRNEELFMLAVFSQSAILSWLVSISFINRLRAEAFMWLVLISACIYNVYYILEKNYNDADPK
ncbi:MAG: hypothetical protein ACI83B_002323 [Sediminicola sp.]